MKIEIVGSTKPGYKLARKDAIDFAGKSAGICYLSKPIDELFNEENEKTVNRAKRTMESGHHSVYDHPIYNLVLIGIPKILAMILNNEKMYTTSEKSARYTKMKVSEEEEKIYLKWIKIFNDEIVKVYPNLEEGKSIKLAQENARKAISIFSPSTTMEYTVSIRQINYILHWFENYIKNEDDTEFNKKLKPYMKEFVEALQELYIPELNSDVKNRKFSLFATRTRQEEFGENYSINYKASFDEFAQAQRHRTINYEMKIPDNIEYSIPKIIQNTELEEEWIEDLNSLKHLYPQGILVDVNERGTYENFILKCQERLCGAAQIDIAIHTKANLEKYIKNVREKNVDVYNELIKYNTGARCTFKGFKCTSPCFFGAKYALDRKI